MGGAISQTTQELLNDAASTTTNIAPQFYRRSPSVAKETSLSTLPEVDENEENNFNVSPIPSPPSLTAISTPTATATTLPTTITTSLKTSSASLTTSLTTSSTTSLTTFQPPYEYENFGRPVLVTRERETKQLDTTKIDKISLHKAAKELTKLLRTIDYEEKKYKFEQKKERKRVTDLKRQANLGTRTHQTLETSPTPEWVKVVSVWQAQNGISGENTLPTELVIHSPDRIRIVTRLVAILVRLGDLEKAQRLWEDTVGKCIQDFGFHHPHTCHSTVGLAYVLFEQNRSLLAEVACRRGLTGLKNVVGDMHPLTRYARRLLIRIVHKLSLLKPQYYEEQERLLREDYHVEQKSLAATGSSAIKEDGVGVGNSLFAHYNLASFCVHFGRYDEAASILRASVATMTKSMLKASTKPPLRIDMQDLSSSTIGNTIPRKPPKTPPKREKCPYVLKHMALNKVERIDVEIQKFEQIELKWKNQVLATINAGHPRSASFYQTKVEAAKMSIKQLKDQKREIGEQEIAREDLRIRRKIQERHTFERAVLRREKLDYERTRKEIQFACGDGVPASESTNLDLLPQAWECVNLLAELLERKLIANNRLSSEEDDLCEREELDALLEWMKMRQEEHSKVVPKEFHL
jgi:hypothetical protein